MIKNKLGYHGEYRVEDVFRSKGMIYCREFDFKQRKKDGSPLELDFPMDQPGKDWPYITDNIFYLNLDMVSQIQYFGQINITRSNPKKENVIEVDKRYDIIVIGTQAFCIDVEESKTFLKEDRHIKNIEIEGGIETYEQNE